MSTIETSPDIKDIAAALLILQGKVEGVRKNGKNPAFKTKYATLESVIDTVRPVLQEAGIVFLQAPGMVVEGKLSLTTRLMHPSSGQWIQSTVQAPLSKQDAQAVGSATTYLCRYSLMAILGVPPVEDDDAHAAVTPPARNAPQRAAWAEYVDSCKRNIAEYQDRASLLTWWNSEERKQAFRDFSLGEVQAKELANLVTARSEALKLRAVS